MTMMKSIFATALLVLSAQVSAQMMNIVYTPDFPNADTTAEQEQKTK